MSTLYSKMQDDGSLRWYGHFTYTDQPFDQDLGDDFIVAHSRFKEIDHLFHGVDEDDHPVELRRVVL